MTTSVVVSRTYERLSQYTCVNVALEERGKLGMPTLFGLPRNFEKTRRHLTQAILV
jgi:hypothetical protein